MSAQSLICASGRFQGNNSDKFYQIIANLSWTINGCVISFSAEYCAHWGRAGTAGQRGKLITREVGFANIDLATSSTSQLADFLHNLSERILRVGERLIEPKFKKGYIRGGVSTGKPMVDFGIVRAAVCEAQAQAVVSIAEQARAAARHQELVAASADFELDESAFGVGMGW